MYIRIESADIMVISYGMNDPGPAVGALRRQPRAVVGPRAGDDPAGRLCCGRRPGDEVGLGCGVPQLAGPDLRGALHGEAGAGDRPPLRHREGGGAEDRQGREGAQEGELVGRRGGVVGLGGVAHHAEDLCAAVGCPPGGERFCRGDRGTSRKIHEMQQESAC